jgi:hypothetical protein
MRYTATEGRESGAAQELQKYRYNATDILVGRFCRDSRYAATNVRT